MIIAIERWGNSAGLPLSKELRNYLHADIGDKVEARLVEDGLLIRAGQAQQRYSLEELLKSCSPEAIGLNPEDRAWLQDAPKAKET